jgi:hypothetical protein
MPPNSNQPHSPRSPFFCNLVITHHQVFFLPSSAYLSAFSAAFRGEFALRSLTHQLVFVNATDFWNFLSFCSVGCEISFPSIVGTCFPPYISAASIYHISSANKFTSIYCYFSCTADYYLDMLERESQSTSSLSVSLLVRSVSIAVNIKVLHSWTAHMHSVSIAVNINSFTAPAVTFLTAWYLALVFRDLPPLPVISICYLSWGKRNRFKGCPRPGFNGCTQLTVPSVCHDVAKLKGCVEYTYSIFRDNLPPVSPAQ